MPYFLKFKKGKGDLGSHFLKIKGDLGSHFLNIKGDLGSYFLKLQEIWGVLGTIIHQVTMPRGASLVLSPQ